ncbi:MAG: pyruvate ferredoxin oxidoreductase, gamma subunit [Deltaproteobacteria bacterium]|nr:pyruvate ferredoxin oxidoreductase, gamma subunit [Deltaproteobacteria bacterium]
MLVHDMIEVRFHGRGGQGAKIASRILGRSGFLAGLYAQDFALFGAERRGAPVVSFTRLSAEPIQQRGDIERPNLVLVMDDSLLKESPAQVFHGVSGATPIIVNADPEGLACAVKELPAVKYFCIDMQRLAHQWIGQSFVSAIAAAAAAKCIPAIKLDQLTEAVRSEIAEFGLAPDLVEKNLAAARAAYDQTPSIDLARAPKLEQDFPAAWQAVPYLGTAQFAGPTIRQRGSAALRATGNWRTERPVIELAKCKRCFLCYLYCPEAAMRLDAENFPHVDYDHCKGCMICYAECPTDAISRRMEL